MLTNPFVSAPSVSLIQEVSDMGKAWISHCNLASLSRNAPTRGVRTCTVGGTTKVIS